MCVDLVGEIENLEFVGAHYLQNRNLGFGFKGC